MACSSGPCGVHQPRARVEGLCAVHRLLDAQVRRVVLQSDREGHDGVRGGRDGEGVLHAERRLQDGHQPDGPGAAGRLQLPDAFGHGGHLLGAFRLGEKNEVGRFRDDRLEILEAQRKLIDPHHALGALEIDTPQRVPHQQPCRVLFGWMDGILEIEDHGIRPMDAGVDHELGLVAGQVEPRAPQPVSGGLASGDRPRGTAVSGGRHTGTP